MGRQAVYLTCETDQSDEGVFFIVKQHPRECQMFRCLPAKHQPRGDAGSQRFQVYNLAHLSRQSSVFA